MIISIAFNFFCIIIVTIIQQTHKEVPVIAFTCFCVYAFDFIDSQYFDELVSSIDVLRLQFFEHLTRRAIHGVRAHAFEGRLLAFPGAPEIHDPVVMVVWFTHSVDR